MSENEGSKLGKTIKALFEEMERLGRRPIHDGSPLYYKEEFKKPVAKQTEISREEDDESMQLELFLN